MPEATAKASPLFVEFHVLRSYPPSNLNRDDLGSPKSVVFGGKRRVRVSSQCLKRTWRMSEFFRGGLAEDQLGVRTQRMPQEVFEKLGAKYDDKARTGLQALFAALGKKAAKEEASAADEAVAADEGSTGADGALATPDAAKAEVSKTDHLLFLSRQEIQAIATFAEEHSSDLSKVVKLKGKKIETDSKALEKLRAALKAHLKEHCTRNAVDVALFGRFLTSDEFGECNAALQVAHALGTQILELEYDYFTAVDDLQPAAETGAGHLGETELCASVLYEYAVCDMRLLVGNLAGDKPLAVKAMGAIARAMCRSVFEKAKKNGTAPHTPADYLEVVVRTDAPVSLANAFLSPVRSEGDSDVMDTSIAALREQAVKYDTAYGCEGIKRFRLCLRDVKDAKPTHASLDDIARAIDKHLAEALS